MQKKNPTSQGSRGKSEPKHISEVLDQLFTITSHGFPTTEPCVDLKLFLQTPFALMPGEAVNGTLGRDSADHFTFVEKASEEDKPKRRRPHYVYRGEYLNVIQKPEGELTLTFRKGCFGRKQFPTYCFGVIRELNLIITMTRG